MGKEMLRLANIQVADLAALRDSYKGALEEKELQYKSLQEQSKLFKQDCGRWRIIECGKKSEPLNLLVVVQFINDKDADLAERIRTFFWQEFPGSPWKTSPIEQTKWFKNPSSSSRIVIFSDHPHAAGIKAAFRDCELVGEKVDLFGLGLATEQQMAADITFVIFPQPPSPN
jgi:hypothetical protein